MRPAGGGAGVDLIAEPGHWRRYLSTGRLSQRLGGVERQLPRHSFRTSQNKLGVATVLPAELATRFAGSSDLFQSNGRKPWHSVNLLVAHDGFTLRDLYSYNTKQNNQPYPFGPSDGGSDNNISWDHGGGLAAQRQAARTGLAILMLSARVPMITGGDEIILLSSATTTPTTWIRTRTGWTTDAQTFASFFHFSTKLMAFRDVQPPCAQPSSSRAPIPTTTA